MKIFHAVPVRMLQYGTRVSQLAVEQNHQCSPRLLPKCMIVLQLGQYGVGSYPPSSGFHSNPRRKTNSTWSIWNDGLAFFSSSPTCFFNCSIEAVREAFSFFKREVSSLCSGAFFSRSISSSLKRICSRRSSTCCFKITALPCSLIHFSIAASGLAEIPITVKIALCGTEEASR
jgi:hypothetical protein